VDKNAFEVRLFAFLASNLSCSTARKRLDWILVPAYERPLLTLRVATPAPAPLAPVDQLIGAVVVWPWPNSNAADRYQTNSKPSCCQQQQLIPAALGVAAAAG
jgi:hypothetical protein